jgi:hypothetical protein
MSTFRKLIAPSLLAALSIGVATPAMAHDNHRDVRYEKPRAGHARTADIRGDIWQLDRKIARAEANRTISRREARGLTNESAELKRLYTAYARGGISGSEYRKLQNRIDRVEFALRTERRDRDGRRG